MIYKMIVLDLDDTLVLPGGRISDRTKEAIRNAQENGISVVLASGRVESGILPVAKQLNLNFENNYILSYNGAKIFKYGSDKPLYELGLNKDQLSRLCEMGKEYGVDVLTYTDKEVLVTNSSEYSELEAVLANMPVRTVENMCDETPEIIGKAMFLAEPSFLAKVEEKVTPLLQDEFYVATSKPFFFEITNKSVNKGKSLHELAKISGVKIEEMIACGDGNNDMTMIIEAGLGVAMGNATELVKNAADIITKSCEEDGVARVIEKIML